MGYVIIPIPHYSSREGINYHCDVLTGRGHILCVICHVAVVAGPTALNHDRRPTYRRRWVIQVNVQATRPSRKCMEVFRV